LLISAQASCRQSRQLSREGNARMLDDKQLLEDSASLTAKARQSFPQLQLVLDQLSNIGGGLEEKETGLSAVVEDYQTRYVVPCRAHANKLLSYTTSLLSVFGSDLGVDAKQTMRAANAYQRIMATIMQARTVAEKALIAGIEALERVQRRNTDGFDLYAQADIARVKSRDLRQDAEGLRQNGREMQVQIEELILRWQSYILLISKRQDDLEGVNRDLDRLQIVSILAKEAVRQSDDSLREAERVHAKVSELDNRITKELQARAKEMQSFSPEELGNIPRKCKDFCFLLEN
jgi:hypothetical protein